MLADKCKKIIMTKDNQKKLYSHFKELAKEGKTDKIRNRAANRAANLLAIYPDFEVKVEPKGTPVDLTKGKKDTGPKDAEEPKPKKKAGRK